MKKLIIISALFLLSFPSFSQIENLLNDQDIIWVAETETEIPFGEFDHLRKNEIDVGI